MRPANRHSVWTIVAPVALLGLVAVSGLLIVETLRSPAASSEPAAALADAPATTVAIDPSVPATYRIRKGDTLSGIAERYGVPQDVIRELNPALDPLALVPGQRIRLRPTTGGEPQ